MITHMENARALGISQLKTICSRYFNGRAVFCSGLMEALMEFLSWQKKGDTMYIAGSLYLVGDIKKILSDQIEKLC